MLHKKPIQALALLLIILSLMTASCRLSRRPDQGPGQTGQEERTDQQGPSSRKPRLPKQLHAQENQEPRLKVYIAQEKKVQEMAFEDYVAGVVGGEIKNDWPLEAIKAQAIIARTFVLQFIEEKGQSKYKNAHVSTDIEEAQAWNADAVNDRIKKAVKETRGQVIVYKGKFVRTWFHSNAGGKTATPLEGVNFKEEQTPYIKVVDSPDTGGNVDAEARKWTASFPKAKVLSALKEAGKPVKDFSRVSIAEKGPSGRAVTIQFDDVRVSGAELRLALGSTEMRSTLLDSIALKGDKVVMTGRGYGHGVGMSQWGAYTMAGQGKKAEDIINHYYKDIDIVKMWD